MKKNPSSPLVMYVKYWLFGVVMGLFFDYHYDTDLFMVQLTTTGVQGYLLVPLAYAILGILLIGGATIVLHIIGAGKSAKNLQDSMWSVLG